MTEPIDFQERAERARKGLPDSHLDEPHAASDRDLRAISPHNPVFQGTGAGAWRGDPMLMREDGLPDGCPVEPLGHDEEFDYFLSARRTIARVRANAGKGDVERLFSPYGEYIVWAWPRVEKNGQVKGNFAADEARRDLFKAASMAGPFDPQKRLRGRGAWRDDGTGDLVLHLGTRLLTPHGVRDCGIYEGRAYPVGPELPQPAPQSAIRGEDLPGKDMLNHLRTWNWQRKDVDARLMLGWIACAYVGGALDWRPYVFATGDAGAGKSTLVGFLVAALGGEDALLKPEDATEAGVAQTLGVDSVPVLLDEAENEADDKRADKLVKLARRAASGNQRLRGGADGKSTLSVIRSCFMFAAINMPSMGDQDMSRMAMLTMRPIPPGKRRIKPWNTAEVFELGRAVHRQVIDWFKFDPKHASTGFDRVLDAFRTGLIEEAGHNDRGADTFGYLLAGFWCATEMREPDPEDISELVAPLHRDTLAELENVKPGWKKCFDFLMDTPAKALERQKNKSVRAILSDFRHGRDPDPEEKWDMPAGDVLANRQLDLVGLRLKWRKGDPRDFKHARLFVPNGNPKLAPLFDRTDWAASNASAPGSWMNALRGGPDQLVEAGKHGDQRGTLIRIAEVLAPSSEDEDTE